MTDSDSEIEFNLRETVHVDDEPDHQTLVPDEEEENVTNNFSIVEKMTLVPMRKEAEMTLLPMLKS